MTNASATDLAAVDAMQLARRQLLEPATLDEAQLHQVLDHLMGRAIDFGELYFQHARSESWTLEDGIVKDGSFNVDRGVGVRAVVGEKTGFAYADEIAHPSLLSAAEAARSIARQGQRATPRALASQPTRALYGAADPVIDVPEAHRVALLKAADAAARAADPRVQEVTVRFSASHESMLVAATDGTLAADVRPLVRFDVSVLVEQNGRRERGNSGLGGRGVVDRFIDEARVTELAHEAVRMALLNLDAVDAPAGSMPVILGGGWPGVLLHEAVGHGLEGDFNRKGSSAFSGRLGEQVASAACTVVDNGTLEHRRGSLSVDDEGTPTQENVLIENGVLKGYLQDKLNARLMNLPVTGNGRRQSYAHLPMPRMTNTYMLPGEHTPEELIASVDRGVYAVNFGGGQVDITSGRFVFSATEAYLIEGGKVTAPIRGATLIGDGPAVMQRVSMVANDLALDAGVGVCGKDGQSVPVGVGQPTLKIDEIVVGGTQTG